jgi:hypothetical protein
MQIDLTPSDLAVLLESLKYSERNVRDAQGTPYGVRQENLQRLANVAQKLRTAAKAKREG